MDAGSNIGVGQSVMDGHGRCAAKRYGFLLRFCAHM